MPLTSFENQSREIAFSSNWSRAIAAYVNSEFACKMADAIHDRQRLGEYAQITSSIEFAKKLTEDLRAVSHDLHLGVNYSHDPIPDRAPGPPSQDD